MPSSSQSGLGESQGNTQMGIVPAQLSPQLTPVTDKQKGKKQKLLVTGDTPSPGNPPKMKPERNQNLTKQIAQNLKANQTQSLKKRM